MKHISLIFFLFISSKLCLSHSEVMSESLKNFIKAQSSSHYLVVLPSNQLIERRLVYESLFSHSKKWIKVSFVMIEKDALSEYSTGDIVKAIRETHSRVVLIGEGKAAADILESLIQYPELSDKVESFFSVKGLIRGDVNAEKAKAPLQLVEVNKAQKLPLIIAMRFLIDLFTDLVYGFDPVMYSFKPSVREEYLSRHNHQLRELAKKVRFYSFLPGRKGYGVLPYSQKILRK